jgi:hypothetical protein
MITRPRQASIDARNLLLFIVLGIFVSTLLAGKAAAETRVGGTLSGETVWTKEGSPYIATRDITVPKGSTLKIGPGVTVRFKADIASREGTNSFDLELLVMGTLILEGAEDDTVYLTTDSPTPKWTDWQGIVLQGKDSRLEARAAIITNANEGIKCFQGTIVARDMTVMRNHQYGVNLITANAEFDNLLVTQVGNSGGTGIGVNVDRESRVDLRNSYVIGAQNGIAFVRNSGGSIHDSIISVCTSRGVIIRKSEVEITGSTISGNDYGLVISAGSIPVVKQNNIFDNATAEVRVMDFPGDETVELDLSGNWWGETHIGLIEERILDGLDDPKVKGIVRLDPVLQEALTHDSQDPPN